MRIAVLASHEGSTMQAVIDACSAEEIAAKVAIVISNNSASGALRRASLANVYSQHISSKTHGDDHGADSAMLKACQAQRVDLILLLGYMKKLGPQTLAAYAGKILNTHPALLPKFGGKGFFGRKVHEAVIAAGEVESGASIHFVDTDYDTGPILAQVKVAVKPADDAQALEERVKTAEQKLLVDTLRKLSEQQAKQ
ncbi:MAG: phosphoribosylglycinamide formyltransferase-1 [Candidatus Azotimanducaceae bacterium]|jgi:phosphoribosylglycinamide formyltransferase-1|tara:strand:+ start:1006 stop:1596 length:591 start_codon:yes stop_codon:yes gene_type:complete